MRRKRKKLPEKKAKRRRNENPYLFHWEPLFVADNSDPLGLVGKLALCFKNGADVENDDPLTSIEIKGYETIEAREIRWMYQQLVRPLGNVTLGEWHGYRADFLRFDGSQVRARFCINHTGSVPLIVTREPNPQDLHEAEQALTEFIVGSAERTLRTNYERRQQEFEDAPDILSLFPETSSEETLEGEAED